MMNFSIRLLLFSSLLVYAHLCHSSTKFSRDDFPPDFVFGAGTSAYQVEGAVAEDGRGVSTWDTYTHAGKMIDKSTGDVAADEYHKYKEDVKLMSDAGFEGYRFSISWSRILPNGRGAVNPKGLKYYNNLINELIKYGIQPHAAIYQLDLPQVLEDEYGGWLSPNIVDDFTEYADVCFREFGDRVPHWTTIIEPNIVAQGGYDTGLFPPRRCSYPFGIVNCTTGNSTVEPYIVVHNFLLAHTSAATLYKNKYQALQNGLIGINLYSFWCYPLTNSSADVEAAQRVINFNIGWILDPLVFGDYPEIMKKNAGSKLPLFTVLQSKQVKGSFDFIGLNHYMSAYVTDRPNEQIRELRDFYGDTFAAITVSKNETPSSQFLPSHIIPDPAGLYELLQYLKQVYGNPAVYIQENGYGSGVEDSLNDTDRIDFIRGFMGSTLEALRNGSNVRGYSVWSFLDVFEFLAGYSSRFGLYHVDFEDKERPRQPKLSAIWYSNFLKNMKNTVKLQSGNDVFGETSHVSC